MKDKTKPASQVQSAAQNAIKIIQAEKEARTNRAGDRIAQVLKETNCTMQVVIIIRPGQYPQGNIEIVALDEQSPNGQG